MDKVAELLETYYKWIKEKTTFKSVNGWEEITTPYLDIHNDYIQIYVKLENDKIVLYADSRFYK